MKSCPTCNRTYPDDSLAFCLMDGSVLSAPFDPAATQSNASARESSPPRTEVLNAAPQSQPLPETRAAAPPPLQPTITAPPPVVPQVQARERSQPPAVAAGRSGVGAKVLVTVAVLIGVAVLGVFLVRSLSRKTAKSNKVDINISGPSNNAVSSTAPAKATELAIRISHNGHILPSDRGVRAIDVQMTADERSPKDLQIKPGQPFEITVQQSVRLHYIFSARELMNLTINGRKAKLPQSNKIYHEVFITTDNYQNFLDN